MLSVIRRLSASFHRDECAATAVEYAVMLALILIAAIAAILNTGDVQRELWFSTSDSVESAVSQGPQL